mmetsp:Transcript_3106/g.5490  ORF Transcript_3106/g.5490 Transcript_3106/m.5490 type:complete len:85 (-) Transcript_3106:112-366(-)
MMTRGDGVRDEGAGVTEQNQLQHPRRPQQEHSQPGTKAVAGIVPAVAEALDVVAVDEEEQVLELILTIGKWHVGALCQQRKHET